MDDNDDDVVLSVFSRVVVAAAVTQRERERVRENYYLCNNFSHRFNEETKSTKKKSLGVSLRFHRESHVTLREIFNKFHQQFRTTSTPIYCDSIYILEREREREFPKRKKRKNRKKTEREREKRDHHTEDYI